jgi:hypothetical protein
MVGGFFLFVLVLGYDFGPLVLSCLHALACICYSSFSYCSCPVLDLVLVLVYICMHLFASLSGSCSPHTPIILFQPTYIAPMLVLIHLRSTCSSSTYYKQFQDTLYLCMRASEPVYNCTANEPHTHLSTTTCFKKKCLVTILILR